LTADQRREVERLTDQLGRLRAVIDTILALMDELKGGTIEQMMAKSDVEVGLEMLTRLARARAGSVSGLHRDQAAPRRTGRAAASYRAVPEPTSPWHLCHTSDRALVSDVSFRLY
jgi:hypothetical protein